jgi:hypothetical protein
MARVVSARLLHGEMIPALLGDAKDYYRGKPHSLRMAFTRLVFPFST